MSILINAVIILNIILTEYAEFVVLISIGFTEIK